MSDYDIAPLMLFRLSTASSATGVSPVAGGGEYASVP